MIAVDWGNTTLRAYRLGSDGAVRVRRRARIGALSCTDHAATLGAQLDDWDDSDVVLCGAVGGRGGWREVPYVPCPANAAALTAGMLTVDTDAPALRGRTVRIVPGVVDLGAAVADTMRGEETQIVGLLQSTLIEDEIVCLPGTHAKWVRVQGDVITSVRTAVTGEVHSLMRRHSVLSRLMDPGEDGPMDVAAFDAGVARSREAGGLLHHLFGVRAQGLVGRLTRAQAPSYLSGSLLGHEVQSLAGDTRRVHLVASAALADAYGRALAAFGIECERHPEELAAAGLHALARIS